ncbi:MAG: FAD-dependent oxidoreductase, partial [Christensenellales bacterium]
MKKLLALLLAMAMVFSLAACATADNEADVPEPTDDQQAVPVATPEPTPEPINGVFEGTGYGMQGKIVVSLTVENSKMTKIEFLENSETPHVCYVAFERIPAQIIEHQTLVVDTVTSATIASYGIMNAVKDAAKNAGLDVAALSANPYRAQPGADESWTTDVLVMGGGGAGLAAAINAAQQGAKVILIEKGSILGGNTMMAGAAYNAVDPAAQAGVILTKAQKDTLDAYLALDPADPALKFDVFPEWAEVLTQLKKDINEFYAANKGKKAGEDMPGFDSIALHMWHIYTGGLRQLNDGSWIASDIDLARTLAENALPSFEWMGS